VGGNETIQTNVRLIAATNRNLEKLVAEGKFRQDLYYRLSVFAIKLPALRERPEDLPTLVSYFLRRYALEMGKNVNGLAPATLDLLKQYPWPGNIRELQSVIQHAILVAAGSVIVPEFLPDTVRLEAMVRIDTPSIVPAAFHDLDHFVAERLKQGTNELYSQWQSVTELRLFQMVLCHTDGNISRAAKVLGIHRATLRGKIAALGLDADERRPWSEELS
jgi:DNA-binding NtrC family response regulator